MTKVLIVDGYNVLRSTGAYQHLCELDWETARAALISDVAAFAHGEWSATVVFDGAGNPSSTGKERSVAGVDVVFSKAGTDADTVIESLAREARGRGKVVLVVTSDAATQWTVMGQGVERMSSSGFISELRDNDESWAEHASAGPKKAMLGERISPEVSEKLKRWARGGD